MRSEYSTVLQDLNQLSSILHVFVELYSDYKLRTPLMALTEFYNVQYSVVVTWPTSICNIKHSTGDFELGYNYSTIA